MKPKVASRVLGTVQAWDTIQKEYPDRFVLLENPVFAPTPHLKEGILLYKHKSRKKVIEKELELKPHYSTIVYTGGIRLDKVNNQYTFVL